MRLEEELGCLGFYGFGSGVDAGRHIKQKGSPPYDRSMYCDRCPLKSACWQKHRARARELFPDITAEFDRLLKECNNNGQRAVQRFREMYKAMPADLTVMTGNLEDGMAVASGGLVHDRGPATLPYPFTSRGGE